MLQTSLVNHLLTRRQALSTAAGLGVGALAGWPASASAATGRIDFDDPAQNLQAFVKLTGDLNPDVSTYGWFGGMIFAVLKDKPLMPLVGVDGFGVMRVAPQENGTFRLFNRELAFYKDPRTQQYIDVWENPLNGERCDVSPIHNAVVNAEVAPILKQDFDGTLVEVPFKPPWTFMGDKAFSTFELHMAFPNPMTVDKWPKESAGPITRISEIFQRITSLNALADPDSTSADYSGTWTRVGPWLPWMLMGQLEGHILYRTFMDKTGPVEKLPPALLARTEERYPEFLEAPGDETWGRPNDSSFSVYMSEREPAK